MGILHVHPTKNDLPDGNNGLGFNATWRLTGDQVLPKEVY